MRETAALAIVCLLVLLGPSAPNTVSLPAGGDLQRALNAAHAGDTILLQPDATYVGSFYLPAKSGNDTRPITVRTATPDGDPVPAGQRLMPENAAGLAKLRSPDGSPALRTEAGARGWRIELLEFQPTRDGAGDIVLLGDGSSAQRSLNDVPTDLVLDRVWIHGDPRLGQKRGVALNSGRTTISNSAITDIKSTGQDSQAIAGWNGPGDYTIENNYLEAAGENVIFGGGDPAIPDLTPSHIVIRGNTLTKPLEWRSASPPWQVKNLLELKNARDVLVEKNVLEHNWRSAQSGYAILFTVRNQDGTCGWCQVENVVFSRNTIRDVAAGVQILGFDNNHPSRQTSHITISDNLFDGIDGQQWGGDGYLLQLTDRPRDLTIDHNTIIQANSSGVAKIDGRVDGFVFTNNIASHGAYGIIGTDHGVGNDTIRALLPAATITSNVLAGGNRSTYPPGNLFPASDELRAQFVDAAAHDFRLRPEGSWTHAATDGTALGADMSHVPHPPREPPPRRRPQ
jgi:hypothetical protein